MSFTIITKQGEKTFTDKQLINISSKPGYDVTVDTGFPFMLTVQYDEKSNRCLLINQFNNNNFANNQYDSNQFENNDFANNQYNHHIFCVHLLRILS